KAVDLSFAGTGAREVAVAYVNEMPVWKTSYRLVLPDQPEGKKDPKEQGGQPTNQGWAIVENTTDEDWESVKLGLVAGRPVSFQMDLYNPLFVPRPVVEPELFASLRPPAYSGGIDRLQEKDKAPETAAPAGERRRGLVRDEA